MSPYSELSPILLQDRTPASLVCDLVIKSRGVFSDFSYPAYIVDMLLEVVGNMVDGQGNTLPHSDEAVDELSNVYARNCMDRGLREEALQVLGHPP